MAENNAINNDIGVATGTSLNLGSTTNMTGMIDDDTFATASANTAASSESIKNYVDNNSFASGTRMVFQQTAAPTGWTKDTTAAINNGALRTVTGSVTTGGSVNFTAAFSSQSVSGTVGNHTLTVGQMPAHNHTYTPPDPQLAYAAGAAATAAVPGSATNTGNRGGGNAHNHSFSGTAINLAVKYYDVIIAQKD